MDTKCRPGNQGPRGRHLDHAVDTSSLRSPILGVFSACYTFRRRPRSATWSCSVLRSSNGPGGEKDGADSTDSGAAEDPDNLLGGQALQALEFWKNRTPSPALPPTQVIGLLMAALQRNDDPAENDGLRTVFEFSSGMCRRAVGGTAESFIKEARYSVFGATVGCQSFTLEPMSMVADRLATQVVSVVASDGRQRRFLWTLERQRRPPDAGKWLIYGVVSSDVDGKLVMEG
ncbi:unnamed protein product [Ectocarpus sp. 8 AP-2014]